MISKRPSSNEVLLSLFPKIEDSLINVILKFSLECDSYTDKKSMKVNIPQSQLPSVLSRFPRSMYGYRAAVDRFVDFGKYSVVDAINLLFTFLPNTQKNDLHTHFISKIANYSAQAELWNDIIVLFFADCTAQLLSKQDNVPCANAIIQIGYGLLNQTNDPIREHLRLLTVRQFSVIFSFLSIEHLDTFLNNFPGNLQRGDISSCYLLHRFLRLTPSNNVTISMIEQFLGQWEAQTKSFKKPSATQQTWAYSLCFLTAQIKTEGLPQLANILNSLYNFVFAKIKDGETDPSHYSLAAIILMRDDTLFNSKYKEFLEKYIFGKAKKIPEATLKAFLMILRGSFVSRSSLFWEWGNFHNNYRPGIEATHLFEPSQPQNDNPSSFTDLLFKNFLSIPGIETHTELLGDILINLAARDFSYFSKDTVPRFILQLGVNSLNPLSEALLQISAPEYHFEEWIADMPLNQGKKILPEIKTLFMQIKTQLYSFVDQLEALELTKTAFWFDLYEPFNTPVFELPMQTLPISSQMSFRITESTDTTQRILKQWRFNDAAAELTLKFETTQIEKVTRQELIHLRLLTFFPHIITFGDLQTQSFSVRMKNYIASSSKAVSMFAINMLSHLYSANASYRLAILNMVLTWISDTSDPQHTFIFLELFVKLFDLSLRPAAPPKPGQDASIVADCPIDLIQQFSDRTQATIIFLLAQPFPELRDLTIAAIERLSKYSNALKVSIPLEHILTDYDVSISTAVAYKAITYEAKALPESSAIPDQLVPFRTAASSRFNHFFSYYIPEIIASFGHLFSISIIDSLVSISIACMDRLSDNPGKLPSTYLNFYQNLAIIISNAVPNIDYVMYKLLLAQFPIEFASFHNYQITSGLSEDKRRVKLAPISQKVTDKLIKLLSFISNSPDASANNDAIIRCFSMIRWTAASALGPQLLEWISSAKISENTNSLIATLRIVKAFAQNPDFKFTLSSQPLYLTLFTTLVETAQITLTNENVTSEKSFNTKSFLSPLLNAYLNAVWFFVTSITIDLEERNEGAFRIPHTFSWMNDFPKPAFQIIHFCEQLLPLRNSHEPSIMVFGDKASRIIAAIIAAVSILNLEKDKAINLFEPLLLESENRGWPIMHFALHRNFKQLINIFINHSYDYRVDVARVYFRSIVSTLIPDAEHLIDNTKTGHKSEDKRTQMILTTMMFTMNAAAKPATMQPPEEDQITAFERVYNRDVLSASGAIMFLAFLYLMDDSFEMRSAAFNLIMRMVPFILAVCEAHDPCKAGETVKKLGKYSALFHSSVLAVPHSTIKKICGIIAQFVPQISEQIIREAIKCLRVSSPTSLAYNMNQSSIIDFIIISLQNVQITNQTILSEISSKFAVYTPYSLLQELLELYPFIRHSGRSTYLNIWMKISQTAEAIESIVDFLLNASQNPVLSTAVQATLLFLSQNSTEVVVSALASRISFSYWFYMNTQLHINDGKPPEFEFTQFKTILSTLIELAQIVPSQLISSLHLIIHFALVFYDYAPNLACTLMFILMSGLKTCPEHITNAFLPPGTITWDVNAANSAFQTKAPISVSQITYDLIEYFKAQKAKRIISAWGKEAAQWTTGCGNLKIASRSAIILSRLLQPIDGITIAAVIRNSHMIAKCMPTKESTEYLMSVFNLLSAIIDRYVSKPDFAESFVFIFKTAQQFVSYTADPHLAQAALTIVAKFVMNGQTSYSQMRNLLAIFTDLMANLEDRRTVDGAFMSCFRMKKPPLDISGTAIEQIAFIAYIPRIYSALASCHNIEPYLTEVNEAEARRILQCALLLAKTNILPQQLSTYFLLSLSKPNTTNLEEFALKCAAHLTQGSIQAIVEAAPLWEHYAMGKNVALREAVFSLVFAFIGIGDFCSGADAFSSIVPLAANSSSEASSNLLERFMKLSSEPIIPVNTQQYIFPTHQWDQVTKVLDQIDNEVIPIPSGVTNLSDSLLLAYPHTDIMWAHKNFAELRQQLSGINVTPFTQRHARMEELKVEVARDESQRLVISQDASDYLEYRNYIA